MRKNWSASLMRGKYNHLPKGSGASLTGFQLLSRTPGGITNTLPAQAERGKGDEPALLTNPNGKNRHGPKPQITCWCEKRILPTTWARIKAGEGETCGHISCKKPSNA